MIIGDNGILTRATEAKTQNEFGKAKEALALANADSVVDKITNGNNEFLANVILKLRAEGYTVEQEVQSETAKHTEVQKGEIFKIPQIVLLTRGTPYSPKGKVKIAVKI